MQPQFQRIVYLLSDLDLVPSMFKMKAGHRGLLTISEFELTVTFSDNTIFSVPLSTITECSVISRHTRWNQHWWMRAIQFIIASLIVGLVIQFFGTSINVPKFIFFYIVLSPLVAWYTSLKLRLLKFSSLEYGTHYLSFDWMSWPSYSMYANRERNLFEKYLIKSDCELVCKLLQENIQQNQTGHFSSTIGTKSA